MRKTMNKTRMSTFSWTTIITGWTLSECILWFIKNNHTYKMEDNCKKIKKNKMFEKSSMMNMNISEYLYIGANPIISHSYWSPFNKKNCNPRPSDFNNEEFLHRLYSKIKRIIAVYPTNTLLECDNLHSYQKRTILLELTNYTKEK